MKNVKKNIRAIALALSISATGLFLTGCATEYEHSVIFQSILDDMKDTTCLDEILTEDDINQWLFENGFKTTSRMGSLVSIAKFVDSFELDKGEYKNFSILENPEDFDNIPSILGTRVKIKYMEPNLKSEYSYELTISSEFDKHLGNGFNIENKLVQLVYIVNESKKLDGNITKK